MKLPCVAVSAALVCLSAAGNCQKDAVSTSAQLPFIYPSFTPVKDHPEVAAFYFSWYVKNQWDCQLDMYPELGEYDSADQAVLTKQINWATQAGLNDLILAWRSTNNEMGQRIDSHVPSLMASAAENNIKIPFMVDVYPNRTPQTVEADVAYLIKTYSKSPAWYTCCWPTPYLPSTSPKPVFLVYYSSSDNATPSSWTKVVDDIHAKYGAVMLVHNNYDPTWVTVGHFDGMFQYGTSQPFNERTLAQSLPAKAWYLPTATPGFNAYLSKGWEGVLDRNSGATYDQSWFNALDLGNDMPMVSVTSFNEWTETSQIEPDTQSAPAAASFQSYGNMGSAGYLDKTADWAAVARAYTNENYGAARSVFTEPNLPFNNDRGLWVNSWSTSGATETTLAGGKAAVTCQPGSTYIYYEVDRPFSPSTSGPVTIRVDYYDSGSDQFHLDYRTASDAHKSTPFVKMGNSHTWRTATFTIPDAFFNGLMAGVNDFRISVPAGSKDAFGLVEVTLSQIPKSRL